jgi:hypothetical protein
MDPQSSVMVKLLSPMSMAASAGVSSVSLKLAFRLVLVVSAAGLGEEERGLLVVLLEGMGGAARRPRIPVVVVVVVVVVLVVLGRVSLSSKLSPKSNIAMAGVSSVAPQLALKLVLFSAEDLFLLLPAMARSNPDPPLALLLGIKELLFWWAEVLRDPVLLFFRGRLVFEDRDDPNDVLDSWPSVIMTASAAVLFRTAPDKDSKLLLRRGPPEELLVLRVECSLAPKSLPLLFLTK